MRLLLFFLFCTSVTLFAQTKAYFTSLNQENGLISGDVMCFQQDNNGFMWIGTKYGLNVFDGVNFNVYHLNEINKPYNSDISTLQKIETQMWIGTLGDGIFVFNELTHKLTPIPISHNGDTILNINCTQAWQNNLYVGTDKGLFKISPSHEVEFIDIANLQNINALAVFNTRLAIGTRNNGLFILNTEGIARHAGFLNEQINALQPFKKNQLLVGTQTAGLFCLTQNDSLLHQANYKNLFNNDTPLINKILIDKNETIWVGTDGKGLFKLKHENNSIIQLNNYTYDGKSRNTIASNAIFALYEDRDGKIWIGTIWKGLSVINQNSTNVEFYFSDFLGDEPYPVLSIFKQNNELWLGTDAKGLNIIDIKNASVKKYTTQTQPNLNGDYVQTIFKDSENKFWIGTFSSGLSQFDKTKGSHKIYRNQKDNKNSLSYNNVRAIIEDKNSDLWVATWGGGLNKFNRKSELFESYSYEINGTSSHLVDNITSICLSHNNLGLWIGTFGNGLFYFDFHSKNFQPIGIPNFNSLKILTLHLDNSNNLWLGTWGNGLKVLKTETLKEINYTALTRISTSRITGIEEDDFGNFWLSSKNGIFKFIPSQNILLKYGGFDLIANKEFHINSSFKDDDGKIYFGGIEGVIAIIPSSEFETNTIDAPVITNLKIYNANKASSITENILKNEYLKLAHNQNYFTLSFSAPHFPVSDVNYSYMLENLNSDWFLSSSDQATFTNIPPGKYVIKVRASLNNFQWSEPTLLPIFIAQPLWKRWYAYFIYVSVFVLLLFLFQKYTRERELLKSDLKLESLTREKEKELNNVKHRFFTNISHEIRTPVTLIIGAANRLIDNGMVNKTSQKELDVMRNSSRHLLNLINELLDFRRLEMDGIKLKVAKGNIVKFVHEIYLSFQTQASSNNIDYRFLSHGDEIELWYDRDQMEKVVYNLISNAFKFTPSGGTITVELDSDDQHGYLKVIDSGEGVENDKLTEIFKRFYQSENAAEIRKTGFGLGLSISKEIVQLHGGEIDALNNVDKGICISVKLPLGNTHFPIEQQLKNFKTSENLENYISSHETLNTEVSLSEYSNSNLLIVEDNAQIREYIKNLFADIKTVLTAANGEEGYNLTLENLPDLIISDVMMPVMDGVTMTKKIKTNMQTSHIPIILLTARTNLIYKKEGFEVGADEYITKPFNETLLKTRVYNLLKSRKLLSEKLLNEYISKPIEELSISTPDQQFLSGLTKVIENNIHENEINTKIISEALCMSHSVVYKKIKNLTGLSIIEFVRDFKLKRAAILLVKYQLTVSDVCYKVGFSDRRYFSKIFKQKFGVTPSEYAKNESNME